jgi:hypothetical protein
MGFAGYVSVCVQLYCVGFHSFTACFGLHGHLQVFTIFYIHLLEGICFAGFFSRDHTLHISICVFPVLFSFVILLFPCVCVGGNM